MKNIYLCEITKHSTTISLVVAVVAKDIKEVGEKMQIYLDKSEYPQRKVKYICLLDTAEVVE